MPNLAGYRRLIVCGVVLIAALGSAVAGLMQSADLASVMLAIVAGFSAPDAVEKFRRKGGEL